MGSHLLSILFLHPKSGSRPGPSQTVAYIWFPNFLGPRPRPCLSSCCHPVSYSALIGDPLLSGMQRTKGEALQRDRFYSELLVVICFLAAIHQAASVYRPGSIM